MKPPLPSEQLGLVGGPRTISPATGRPLTPYQQEAYRLVCETPGGVKPEVVGAFLHAVMGKHAASLPCQLCYERGRQVLSSKGLKPLVVHRRKLGVWQPRDPKHRLVEPSSQIRDGQLPGDRFEDLFGGAA